MPLELAQMFEELKIPVLEEGAVFSFWIEGSVGQWVARALARADEDQLIVYSLCPVEVPPELFGPVTEFLNRVNFTLGVGSFELDYSDGEPRFRTGVPGAGSLNTPTLGKLLDLHRVVMEQVLPPLRSLATGEADLATAMKLLP